MIQQSTILLRTRTPVLSSGIAYDLAETKIENLAWVRSLLGPNLCTI